jgi:hypothetical protein
MSTIIREAIYLEPEGQFVWLAYASNESLSLTLMLMQQLMEPNLDSKRDKRT